MRTHLNGLATALIVTGASGACTAETLAPRALAPESPNESDATARRDAGGSGGAGGPSSDASGGTVGLGDGGAAPGVGGQDGGKPKTDGGSAGGPPLAPPTCIAKAGLPAWRAPMVVGAWKVLSSADLSKVTPSPAPTGNPVHRIDAWNGIAADTEKSHLWIGGVGGHADYAGNEVYTLDLNAAAPVWSLLSQPSPASTYTYNEEYFSDGRPSPAHTYYSLWFVEPRGQLFRFPTGATWGNGAGGTTYVDLWDPAKKDWGLKGTRPTMGTNGGVEMPTAKHSLTGDVYQMQTDAHLYRWNQATDTVSDLGASTIGSGTFYDTDYAPAVVDSKRNILYFMSDNDAVGTQIRAYNIATKAWSRVTLTGAGAAVASAKRRANQGMVFYDHCADALVFKSKQGAEVVFVDAATFVATPLVTSGSAPPSPHSLGSEDAGVHTLFQYIPKLGGYAYQPLGSSPLYFLATQ